nr:uncharacterized protein CI109_001290 [Kwoniella shandongensis]KAA5530486.1 hypothetical protein CI109_001290 [Kwoniella shandongensis]
MSRMTEAEVDPDDDLRDLSLEDAQVLRAFVEKRRWFEGKLKILEAIPPVYPFLHPVLIPQPEDNTSFLREGATDAKFRLPDESQVQQWQREREAIEEEVLEFDGGDLERMKEKTRAVTLLPLTPPSTHLVSITLDLIVLIDRLLTLLRHRGHVLELTSLRLQWDQVRWQIMCEARKLQAEVDDVVRDKGRWTPSSMPDTPENGVARYNVEKGDESQVGPEGDDRVSVTSTPTRPTQTPGTIKSLHSLASAKVNNASAPTSSLSPSPSRRALSSKRSMLLPLLHSHLVSMKIRHRNLVSTQSSRCGSLLDRMIDVAGPLKGLGDVHGPCKGDKNDEGAVPEELLDLQDDLDKEVEELGGKVEWCKTLEEHWKLCESHHSASSQAQQAAQTLLHDLHESLTRPATSEQHRHLSTLLQTAQLHLPPAITVSFPQPSHPSYPDIQSHNVHVAQTLAGTYTNASELITSSRLAIDWYGRLALAREKIAKQRDDLLQRENDLRKTIETLAKGTPDAPRPDLNDITNVQGDHELWLRNILQWTSEAKESTEGCADLVQKVTLAVMQYRNIVKTVPKGIRQDPVKLVVDDLPNQAEQDRDRIQELARPVSSLWKIAEQDQLVLSAAQQTIRTTQDLHKRVQDQSTRITTIINAAAERKAPLDNNQLDSFLVSVNQLNEASEALARPRAHLYELLRSPDRPLPALQQYLNTVTSELTAEQVKLNESFELLKRVAEQAKVVRDIENETDRLLEKIGYLQQRVEEHQNSAEDLAQGAIEASLGDVENGARTWEAGLSERVPFVSRGQKYSSASVLIHSQEGHGGAPIEQSLLQQDSIPAIHSYPADGLSLTIEEQVDRATRETVNNNTIRVVTAITHCKNSYQQMHTQRWGKGCHTAAEEIDRVLNNWEITSTDIRKRIEAYSTDVANPTETGHAVESFQNQVRSTLQEHEKDLENAVSSFRSVVEARPATTTEADAQVWQTALKTANDAIADALSEVEQISEEVDNLLLKAKSEPKVQHPAQSSDHDVFGPQSSSISQPSLFPSPTLSGSSEPSARIQLLRNQLDGLEVKSLVHPTTSQIQSTPTLKRLPTDAVAFGVKEGLYHVSEKINAITLPSAHPSRSDLQNLQSELKVNRNLVAILDRLVVFSKAVETSDSKLSRLLELVDIHEAGQDATLLSERDDTAATIKRMLDASVRVEADLRVASEMKRVRVAWEELQILVNECLDTDRNVSTTSTHSVSSTWEDDSDIVKPATTTRSTPASRLPRLTTFPKTTNRSASNPMTTPNRVVYLSPAPTPSSRQRAVSETPTRLKNVRNGPGISRPRNEIGRIMTPVPGTPNSGSTRERQSSIPRLVKATTPTISNLFFPTTRTPSIVVPASRSRRVSRLPEFQPEFPNKTRKEYVADPKSKLDIAVGNVVNKLGVDIPMRPVGLNTSDEWKDQSGKYWIGAEGRAKLCFCRILRSRTVMVRVGGGWVELSKFLLDHFAGAIGSMQTPFDSLPLDSSTTTSYASNAPVLITSASLSSFQNGLSKSIPISISNSSLASIESSKKTPIRKDIPLPETPNNHLSPDKARHLSPHTPGSNVHSTPATSGSPLVAFKFMRKASESPTLREKEKERFVGRRSILGKERAGSEGL